MTTLTKSQLVALADAHIKRFTKLIAQSKNGASGIREDECEHYQGLWVSIKAKSLTNEDPYPSFTRDEKSEIGDAVSSGDYDTLLENCLS